MPRYERYWRNPKHHRAQSNQHHRYLVALGIRRIDQLSPAAQKNEREYQNNYHKTHRALAVKVERKFRQKLVRLYGSTGHTARWLHHMKKEEENARERKAKVRTATLSRKLVESIRPTNLVFGRTYKQGH